MIPDPLEEFLKILHHERGEWVDENDISTFPKKKICLGQMNYIGPKNCITS